MVKYINVENIAVTVVYRNVKNLRINVARLDGSVRLIAPLGLSLKEAEAVISKNVPWILKKQAELAAYCPQGPHEFVDGRELPVWGKPYQVKLVYASARYALCLEGEQAILTVREGSSEEQRRAFVNRWYQKQLAEAVQALLPQMEARTGLHAKGVVLNNTISRWGSCNTKTHVISLSLQLAKQLPVCLEYTLLHELVHTRIAGHQRDFYELVERFMPDWRRRKAQFVKAWLEK